MERKTKFLLPILMLLFSGILSAKAQQADAITGVWNNTEKDGQIEIFKENGKYSGKIVWLKDPSENGKPKLDKNNANASLRNQPILGLKILKDFTFEEGTWEDGTIYDPKNGKTYSCVISLKSPEVLEVRGYIGVSLLGRTVLWSRARAARMVRFLDLVLCLRIKENWLYLGFKKTYCRWPILTSMLIKI